MNGILKLCWGRHFFQFQQWPTSFLIDYSSNIPSSELLVSEVSVILRVRFCASSYVTGGLSSLSLASSLSVDQHSRFGLMGGPWTRHREAIHNIQVSSDTASWPNHIEPLIHQFSLIYRAECSHGPGHCNGTSSSPSLSTELQSHRSILGVNDVKPLDELISDLGDEHPGCYWVPPQSQCY
jgi:hypothetical protein